MSRDCRRLMELHVAYLEKQIKLAKADTNQLNILNDILNVIKNRNTRPCSIQDLPKEVVRLILKDNNLPLYSTLAFALVSRGSHRHFYDIFVGGATAIKKQTTKNVEKYYISLETHISFTLPITKQETIVCYRCQQTGHTTKHCLLKCRRCGKTGHSEKSCNSIKCMTH